MYNLHLTPEQLEFRDTVRDFVEAEIKPVALHPDRLQPFEKPLLLGPARQGRADGIAHASPCPRTRAARAPTASPPAS